MFKNREMRIQLHKTNEKAQSSGCTHSSLPAEKIAQITSNVVERSVVIVGSAVAAIMVLHTVCNIAENRATRESK